MKKNRITTGMVLVAWPKTNFQASTITLQNEVINLCVFVSLLGPRNKSGAIYFEISLRRGKSNIRIYVSYMLTVPLHLIRAAAAAQHNSNPQKLVVFGSTMHQDQRLSLHNQALLEERHSPALRLRRFIKFLPDSFSNFVRTHNQIFSASKFLPPP